LRKARADRSAVWVIKHRGVEHSTHAGKGDLAKAQAALAEYIRAGSRPNFGQGHPAEVMIADVLAEYGDKHSATTRRPEVIGLAIDKLLDFWGGKRVAAVTPAACNDFVSWRTAQRDGRAKGEHGRHIKASTARRELVVLAAAMQWCWREGKLDRPIPVKMPAQAEPRERHLIRTEAARLLWGAMGFEANGRRHLARINRHLARFILLGLYTGTRHDAMLKLQWGPNTTGGWVDLGAGVLYRRPREATDKGKRRPAIPIPPRLLPHLRRWRGLTARFVIEWQGKPIASQERRAWGRARELAGLGPDVTPHVLRHTCATWLLQHGVSIYDVAGVLGCGENVIRRTYGHHAHDQLRAAVEAFSRRPTRAPVTPPATGANRIKRGRISVKTSRKIGTR
jgi:integrase